MRYYYTGMLPEQLVVGQSYFIQPLGDTLGTVAHIDTKWKWNLNRYLTTVTVIWDVQGHLKPIWARNCVGTVSKRDSIGSAITVISMQTDLSRNKKLLRVISVWDAVFGNPN